MTAPRYQWYQSPEKVYVSVFVKKAEGVEVNFSPRQVAFRGTSAGVQYELNVKLAQEIDADASSYEALTTKVEIVLAKKNSENWATLESSESGPDLARPSQKTGEKNWDRVAADLDEPEEESINDVFSKIYANASDEQKRAMAKSYQESAGTTLSTNWDDIKDKRTPVRPPDSMYEKKY